MNKPKQFTGGWKDIDWKQIDYRISKLQRQIYKATKQGDITQVRRLQHTLLKRFDARLLAVRKVTQDNRGKITAGLDGRKSLSPQERLTLAENLRITGKATPVKRIYIPKPGKDETRPLGIPTLEDRARQALVKLALEPEWEARFEPNSYGFRPGRNCHDAIAQIKISIERSPKYVLDADISKCFDSIDHEYLLQKLNQKGQLRKQIKSWLKAGFVEFPTKEIIATEVGTPQGGVISPLLANIALHGLESILKRISENTPQLRSSGSSLRKVERIRALTYVRYADDFVILHPNKEILLQCKMEVEKFLSPIGLKLSEAKTRISHTLHPSLTMEGKAGFDFLGFTILQKPSTIKSAINSTTKEKLGFDTLIFPSKKSQKSHQMKLSMQIRNFNEQEALISNVNPMISGWARYFGVSDALTLGILQKMDVMVYRKLIAWATKKQLGMRGNAFRKYWHRSGNRWVFGKPPLTLCIHQDYASSILQYVKVRGDASPYDGNESYWKKRLARSPEFPTTKKKLLSRQNGNCSFCNLPFQPDDVMEIHHTIPKKLGGKDAYSNLVIVHGHCHDKLHAGSSELIE